MNFDIIIATRPNYIKAFPVYESLKEAGYNIRLIHTNQHYDYEMSTVFFKQLGNIQPNIVLNLRKTISRIVRFGDISQQLEKIWQTKKPAAVFVFGDVDSTFVSAMTAQAMNIPVFHVESGMRSFDRNMPEEINRVLTDHISEGLFATEESALKNLRNEGLADKTYFVGNTMIDTLAKFKDTFVNSEEFKKYIPNNEKYSVITFHRHEHFNVKDFNFLKKVILTVTKHMNVIFPMHPRTDKYIEQNMPELLKGISKLKIIKPLGYIEFMNLVSHSCLVITDSGGIQEETTFLGVPCFTLRTTTERPATVSLGSNVLIGLDTNNFVNEFNKFLKIKQTSQIPPLWDGKASKRIVEVIRDLYPK